jgi:hypothetical protein
VQEASEVLSLRHMVAYRPFGYGLQTVLDAMFILSEIRVSRLNLFGDKTNA